MDRHPSKPTNLFLATSHKPTGGPLNPYREYQLSGPLGAGLGFRQIGGGSDVGRSYEVKIGTEVKIPN
jgi:hypothetical protein